MNDADKADLRTRAQFCLTHGHKLAYLDEYIAELAGDTLPPEDVAPGSLAHLLALLDGRGIAAPKAEAKPEAKPEAPKKPKDEAPKKPSKPTKEAPAESALAEIVAPAKADPAYAVVAEKAVPAPEPVAEKAVEPAPISVNVSGPQPQ